MYAAVPSPHHLTPSPSPAELCHRGYTLQASCKGGTRGRKGGKGGGGKVGGEGGEGRGEGGRKGGRQWEREGERGMEVMSWPKPRHMVHVAFLTGRYTPQVTG